MKNESHSYPLFHKKAEQKNKASRTHSSEGRLNEKQEKILTARVSGVSIMGNVFLSAFKLVAGILGHSSAMVSDAVHSLSDVLTTVIALIGVKAAKRGADAEHPYGHDRFECVSSEILAILLLVTGAGIGLSGIRTVAAGNYDALEIPGILPLIAAIVSIASKEAMYHYTKACAKKLRSSAFMADAWHHRSDALSSIGSLIGVAGARAGFSVLDPLASVAISVFILKVAVDIFRDAIRKMTDTACDEEYTEEMRQYIISQEGVARVDLLQTRMFGEKIYVDVEIAVDAHMELEGAHEIAERVHDGLEQSFDNIKHVMVHVNPYEAERNFRS
ncbi:MAG: cation diffusion facilitator family transporter [Lachnospiraceae bacterium]|nr:cation diffusion facilitator family transporter [Lachnospiraceae bacterium]